jgi:hypothetical protein
MNTADIALPTNIQYTIRLMRGNDFQTNLNYLKNVRWSYYSGTYHYSGFLPIQLALDKALTEIVSEDSAKFEVNIIDNILR